MIRAITGGLAAQGYNALIGIVIMPVYLALMGREAFGLIGIYLLVQAAMALLDFGITPTVAREMALAKSHSTRTTDSLSRFRSVEYLFGVVALVVCGSGILASAWLAEHWLSTTVLSTQTVTQCLMAMAVAAALRWLCALYRGALSGLEEHDRINAASVVFSTLRFVAVIPLLRYVDASPVSFFGFQCLVGLLELTYLYRLCHRSLPGDTAGTPSIAQLYSMLGLAGHVGVLSAIWLVLTQVDKLVLSHTLGLDQYAIFSLAAVAAGSVFFFLPVINQVLQPRMTILLSRGDTQGLSTLYRCATQLLSAAMAALGGAAALHSELILLVWTQDPEVANQAADILAWYALGNTLAVLSTIVFLLQLAHGDVSLHVRGNLIMITLLLPILIFVANRYGPVAVGQCFLVARVAFFVLWIPQVHRRFMPEVTLTWPLQDVLWVALVAGVVLAGSSLAIPSTASPYLQLAGVGFSCLCAFAAACLAGTHSRRAIISRVLDQ